MNTFVHVCSTPHHHPPATSGCWSCDSCHVKIGFPLQFCKKKTHFKSAEKPPYPSSKTFNRKTKVFLYWCVSIKPIYSWNVKLCNPAATVMNLRCLALSSSHSASPAGYSVTSGEFSGDAEEGEGHIYSTESRSNNIHVCVETEGDY